MPPLLADLIEKAVEEEEEEEEEEEIDYDEVTIMMNISMSYHGCVRGSLYYVGSIFPS